jgi:phage terminase small subunit
MASRGRSPYETTDETPFGLPNQRLKPPPGLKEPEKSIFLDLVTQVPATQFQGSDVPLIVRYCELVALCEQAMREMRATGMVDADGKPSSWFSIYTQAVKALTTLAMRLRLGPQSRAFKAPKRTVAPLSYYDRLALGGDADAEEAEDEAEAQAQAGRSLRS